MQKLGKYLGHSKTISIVFSCLLSFQLQVAAITYYVSTNGNNTLDGMTTNTPWKDISHAMVNVANNDIVRIMPGIYREFILVSKRITINGWDSYNYTNAPLARHQSATIILPPNTNNPNSPLINIATNGVKISNLTISGDSNNDGIPDAKAGINALYRPIEINTCKICNFNGYGIKYQGDYPIPAGSDNDTKKGFFIRNTITNITHTNVSSATGIFTYKAPSEIISNAFYYIAGTNSRSAIYIERCYYTSNMTSGIKVNGNYFRNCTVGIWANSYGEKGEPINICSNTVTNGLIGIRITAARGKATVCSNKIQVYGISESGLTPARGLWIQSDSNPWSIAEATDHLVRYNVIFNGLSTVGDLTTGMYFSYNSSTTPSQNNGVRATVISNFISSFDIGSQVISGSSGVGIPHDPLVEVIFHYNDIEKNKNYGIFSSGMTNTINALDNWWGSYGPPFPSGNISSANVITNIPPMGRFTVDTDNDGIMDYLDDNDDGDRYSDLTEIYVGTYPDDPLSQFEIAGIRAGATCELKWKSLTNRIYFIYRTTNLLEGFPPAPWTFVFGSPPTNYWTDLAVPSSGAIFYRITCTN